MIIKIRIDLNDPDQRDRYERMMKADAMAGVMWELMVNKKKEYERVIDLMEENAIAKEQQPESLLGHIIHDIRESLYQEGIDIEKLYR